MTRRRSSVWLIGVTLFALVSAACTRVQSHFELPTVAAEDPSFLPTIEAYTSTAHGGNSATLLHARDAHRNPRSQTLPVDEVEAPGC